MANPGGENDTYYRFVRELAFSLSVIEMQRLVRDVEKNLTEIETKLEKRRPREQFLQRMRENAAEFEKWLIKVEARKIRKTGGDADAYWKTRRSETEEDSEEEVPPNAREKRVKKTSEEKRNEKLQRERLFRLYWKEKHQYPSIFSRTMNEYLSGEEDETEDSEEESEKDTDEDMKPSNNGYGTPASSDDEYIDPEDFYDILGEISEDDEISDESTDESSEDSAGDTSDGDDEDGAEDMSDGDDEDGDEDD